MKFDSATISGLPARNIGSATMSGRIAAVDAVHENGRMTVFAGAASGGVWKSVNGGTTFKPVFDRQSVQSIGAVTIDPSNPKTVWVGTGEAGPATAFDRQRSLQIDRWRRELDQRGAEGFRAHRQDPGRPEDGNSRTGCAPRGICGMTTTSAASTRPPTAARRGTRCWRAPMPRPDAPCWQEPQEPKTIYASMWDFRRQGWTFRSGGRPRQRTVQVDRRRRALDGDHRSNSKGLPAKPYGRIALAVAPSKPQDGVRHDRVRSRARCIAQTTAGKNWKKLDASQFMVWRPFYFANLIVDPKDENKIFKPDLLLLMQRGRRQELQRRVQRGHGDFHAVWIDPENPNVVYRRRRWRLVAQRGRRHPLGAPGNLPVSQFYHVSVDNADPYHVYGGLQDNSSWVGDSSYPGGVSNSRWENMYGGDGFWMFEDPSDPDYIYAEAQGGEIGRVNRHTHERRAIKPYAEIRRERNCASTGTRRST